MAPKICANTINSANNFCERIMKKENYKSIIEQNSIPSKLYFIYGYLEQKTTNSVNSVLKDIILTILSQCPKLYPIVLLWEELDRNINNKYSSSQGDMWKTSHHSWNNIVQ